MTKDECDRCHHFKAQHSPHGCHWGISTEMGDAECDCREYRPSAGSPKLFRVRLLKHGEPPEGPRWLSPYGTFAFTLEAAGVFESELAAEAAFGHMIAEYQLLRPGYSFPAFTQKHEPVGPVF